MHDKSRRSQLPLQGSAMCIASGNLPRFLVFLFSEAPAGRHVYRRATCLATQAPAGRHVRRIGLMHDKSRRSQLPLQGSAMCIASGNLPRFLVFLFSEAPAGRHVYRRATCLATQAPAGRHVCRIGLMHDKSRRSQLPLQGSAMCIASGNLPRFLVFLFSEAPAGRHVYRRATCLATQAPAGRHVCRIGLMHDKSRKTSFSLQRSDMSIGCRYL